jgi:hypothetical protein
MSDRMTIIGKDGRARYIIEYDSIIDLMLCKHEFEDEESPCIYCNLYKDELGIKEE